MKKKDALKMSMQENNIEVPNNINTTLMENSKGFKEFSASFYAVMAEAGYSKCDPKNLAKYYKRLDEIASCDYVEPRDALAAIKTLLQYNDIDTKQLQQKSKDEKEIESLDEIKNLVSNLKSQYNKKKEPEIVIDIG